MRRAAQQSLQSAARRCLPCRASSGRGSAAALNASMRRRENSTDCKEPVNGGGGLHAPFGKYSHAVSVQFDGPTRLLVTSGQLATTTDGDIPAGCAAQSELIFRNLGLLLDEAGLRRHDVVHLRTYVTAREHFPEYMAARDTFLQGVDVKPASTLLVVGGFTNPDHVVEVEMTAVEPRAAKVEPWTKP